MYENLKANKKGSWRGVIVGNNKMLAHHAKGQFLAISKQVNHKNALLSINVEYPGTTHVQALLIDKEEAEKIINSLKQVFNL